MEMRLMYLDEYKKWLNSTMLSENEKEELKSIANDEKEIESRFYTNLSFGTAGMRGIRGIGKNRMNKYNIRKATQGLANYIIQATGESGKKKGVAIAYDSRLDSVENALNTAMTLAGNGIKVYLFDGVRSTPELSFAVRELKAQSGIMITASHNPKEYNGYKVYWEDGAQIVDPQATAIVSAVEAVDIFNDIKLMDEKEAIEKGLLVYVGEKLDDRYIEEVKKNAINPDVENKDKIKIVYSPLHGVAARPVERILKEMGYTSVFPVKEQEQPDGNFPTCDYANPEDTNVFKLSTELADKVGAEICIANDPDGDRVGLAVLNNDGKWFFPNGNQIGILFAEYILNHKKDIPTNGTMITTIVSTPLLDTIVKKNGKKALRVLTGFKYIGEKIRQFENKELDGTFLFGFEEAIGYLVGTHVRDKDAVVASMIIAEMATTFKNNGSSIYNEIIKIYEKYGWRLETTIPVTKKGKDGLEEIQKIMKSMRAKTHTEIAGIKVKEYRDYQKGVENLPKADVIQIVLEDETYLTVRPSGTEPKIKFYISVVDSDKKVAEEKLAKLEKEFINYAENI
ncbi:phosphoglucomutase/phosphomannomutase, alpha/beta/alpha domain II [Fusobacterium periodonticum ATCC 33693]|uniref:Phosphoglucomutase/phosphomannomutase, alpha/beta/alpha domain II n=2 Tax=Fusobacterium periodonticum TaxID=860 RepID=D4CYK5_9FUSO|nr:phosphoglucomutase/phosphomannomutase, alpha/beta/alpha domain II [Fusobacterium periodonticum ATCC 33693]